RFDEMVLPPRVVPVRKVFSEMCAAALFAAKGCAGDQPRNGHEIELAPDVSVHCVPVAETILVRRICRIECCHGMRESGALTEEADRLPHQRAHGRGIGYDLVSWWSVVTQ